MIEVLAFLCGLTVGSFLNVVIYRLQPVATEMAENSSDAHPPSFSSGKEGFSVLRFSPSLMSGRSFCPHCRKTLRWYELIPLVSYIVQSGQCNTCKSRISLQYPIVELSTAILFFLIATQYFRENIAFPFGF